MTLTKEQARRLRNDFECWQQDYDPKDDKEQYDMFGRGMVAMDMLLASMGSAQEPVAWIVHARTGDQLTSDGNYVANAEGILGLHSTPLYSATPAPVVECPFPCGWENLNKYVIQNAAFVARGLVEGEVVTESYRQAVIANNDRLLKVIAACRAAMLQAGNSPVTPDGWIPVSERMPEKADEVLRAKEFDGPGDWRQKVGYYLAGELAVYGASWTPTHWMPLPAAPQKEVK